MDPVPWLHAVLVGLSGPGEAQSSNSVDVNTIPLQYPGRSNSPVRGSTVTPPSLALVEAQRVETPSEVAETCQTRDLDRSSCPFL